jgi:hypothetical protein
LVKALFIRNQNLGDLRRVGEHHGQTVLAEE